MFVSKTYLQKNYFLMSKLQKIADVDQSQTNHALAGDEYHWSTPFLKFANWYFHYISICFANDIQYLTNFVK